MMNKGIVLALILCASLLLTACGAGQMNDQVLEAATAQAEAKAAPDAIEIREKMFIAQVNEIYVNAGDYLGKTIRYEGVFDSYPYNDAGDMFNSVIRYGPGCCGNDGNVGFEVVSDKAYPKQGDWVLVEGKLEEYVEAGNPYLRLSCTRLEVLSERGNSIVSQ